jgi:hypothetical protein
VGVIVVIFLKLLSRSEMLSVQQEARKVDQRLIPLESTYYDLNLSNAKDTIAKMGQTAQKLDHLEATVQSLAPLQYLRWIHLEIFVPFYLRHSMLLFSIFGQRIFLESKYRNSLLNLLGISESLKWNNAWGIPTLI